MTGYTPLGILTHVRIDRVVNLADRKNFVTIARYSMGSVPCAGESVNVNGDPYQVIERGWAVGEEGSFAYLRVFGYQKEPQP